MQFHRAVEAGRIVLQRQQRERIGRKIRFRHRRAAAIDRAALLLRAIGIVRPALPRRHHVAVRVQRDHRSRSEALAHDEVGHRHHAVLFHHVVRHRVALDLEAELSSSACAACACGAQSPGGLSDGTRTSAFRNSTWRGKFRLDEIAHADLSWSNRSMKRISAAIASPMSATLANSAGL